MQDDRDSVERRIVAGYVRFTDIYGDNSFLINNLEKQFNNIILSLALRSHESN